tara:strand:+ start:737 stop:1210 length:474 start_codon:yes stop_codon:yes gene_type:complete
MTSDQLPGKLTIEKLEQMTVKERENLWINARSKDTEEANFLVTVIESLGLPYSEDGGMKLNSPIAIKMRELIDSREGRRRCIEATKNDMPALAGLDKELNELLGVDYRGGNAATQTAGYFVGEVMRSLGYTIKDRRPMPPGSVAKTAAFWVPRPAIA